MVTFISFTIKRFSDIAGDHRIPGKNVLLRNLFKHKAREEEIAEVGIEVDELGGEEDVLSTTRRGEDGVDALGEVGFGAPEKEKVEIHVVVLAVSTVIG